jgi:subtilisin family serine protease
MWVELAWVCGQSASVRFCMPRLLPPCMTPFNLCPRSTPPPHAQGATIISVRVLGCDGMGFNSWVVNGLSWVLAAATASPSRRAVAHLSLGTSVVSVSINDAVQALTNAGVVVVAAAGNTATDACTVSPASGECGDMHEWLH